MSKLTGGLGGRTFLLNGLLQQSDIKTDRGAVTASGDRSQDSAETGISYHQHAEGAGRTLSDAIIDAKDNVRYCKELLYADGSGAMPHLQERQRDHKTIMVVENTRDLAAYEKTGKYEGVYHVLHGAISPMLGIGPARYPSEGADGAS